MKWTVQKKLVTGFGAFLVAIVVLISIVVTEINRVNALQTQIMESDEPSVIHAEATREGINKAMAGLRGYLATGESVFKEERAAGWEIVHCHLDALKILSDSWDAQDVHTPNELQEVLAGLALAQQSVEDISHTAGNRPVLKILSTEAAPRAKVLQTSVMAMNDIEKEIKASPQRRAFLVCLADTCGSLAMGLASIRTYVLEGDVQFKEDFRKHWQTNTDRYDALKGHVNLFTPEQEAHFKIYVRVRAEFEPLHERIFAIRESEGWNVAIQRLTEDAAPCEARSDELLSRLVVRRSRLAQDDTEMLQREGQKLAGAALLVLVAVALFLWFFITGQKKAERKLSYEAFHDKLTGLANRALMFDRLACIIERAKHRQEGLFAALYTVYD